MIRLLILVHNRVGLSAFLRARGLSRWLTSLGYEITVIAGRLLPGLQPLDTFMEGARVLQLPDLLPARIRHGGLSPMDIAGRLVHVLRNRYDLVHAFGPRPATVWPALLARRTWGTPYIADCADLWGRDGIAGLRRPLSRVTLGRFDGWMEELVWRQADGIVALTSDMMARVWAGGLPRDRIRLIQVGADFEHITPLPKLELRAKYGVPLDAEVVVHTGFTHYDARLLAEMFVALTRLNPKAFLLMSGGRLPEVEHHLAENGLSHRLRHVGFVPYAEVGEVLACADVAVMPYSDRPVNRGRFPIRFGDYLAAARPIITNPTGDVGHIVQQEEVGSLAPEEPKAFAEVVQSLLVDPARQAVMGRRARRLAETRYAWRVMAGQLDDLYRHLLAHGRRQNR